MQGKIASAISDWPWIYFRPVTHKADFPGVQGKLKMPDVIN